MQTELFQEDRLISISKTIRLFEERCDVSKSLFFSQIRHRPDFVILIRRVGKSPKILLRDVLEYIKKLQTTPS